MAQTGRSGSKSGKTRVLLVEDETVLRHSMAERLSLRGFEVVEAGDGEAAMAQVGSSSPDIVVLDLKMGGVGGVETLQRIRRQDRTLPVVILTGRGHLKEVLACLSLGVSDFLHKPLDAEALGGVLTAIQARAPEDRILREKTLAELMVPPGLYPRVYSDQPVDQVFDILTESFLKPPDEEARRLGLRSALVYDREERFVGIVRFSDLLKLALPGFMSDSPYFDYFSGMFLAQCKLIGQRALRDIMGERVDVDVEACLMEAVRLMVQHRLISLPVMRGEELAGVIRERDVILEISREMRRIG